MKRELYYLCRYVRTEELKRPGVGYTFNAGRIPDTVHRLEPSYIYRLKRDSVGLYLTDYEVMALRAALEVEGCPHLLSEADAIDGRAI